MWQRAQPPLWPRQLRLFLLSTLGELELVEERGHEPGARCTERVAEGDGTAVRVDAWVIVGQPQVAHTGQGLGSKGLVEFEHIDSVYLDWLSVLPDPLPMKDDCRPVVGDVHLLCMDGDFLKRAGDGVEDRLQCGMPLNGSGPIGFVADGIRGETGRPGGRIQGAPGGEVAIDAVADFVGRE